MVLQTFSILDIFQQVGRTLMDIVPTFTESRTVIVGMEPKPEALTASLISLQKRTTSFVVDNFNYLNHFNDRIVEVQVSNEAIYTSNFTLSASSDSNGKDEKSL